MAVDKTKDILVGGILHSIATGNIIAHADEVMDEDYGKKQSEINQELSSRLTEELKDYLPLTGGTLTGNLTVFNNVTANGYSIPDKSSTDLLNAVGGTTSVEDLRTEIGKDYLPLSGGTLTGDIKIGRLEYDIEFESLSYRDDFGNICSLGSAVRPAIRYDIAGYNKYGHIELAKYGNDVALLIKPVNDNGETVYTGYGVIIPGKTTSDLLNAGGSTTSISDIISLANVPTNVSDLNNDSNFQTASQVTTTVNNAIDALVNGAPEAMDTLKELSDALNDQEDAVAAINQTLATKVATINASGTSPLTLSANKSGTTVNLTGSIASGKISANSIALTNQDLNDYNDISHVGYYYAGGGNTVTNKPSGIYSFGMVILRTASEIVTQIIYGQRASGNIALEIYYRRYYIGASENWSSWKRVASTENLDNYATTEALTSGLAKKANSTHTHGVADISGLSNVATSGSYNDLADTPTIATTTKDGLMSAADKTKLDTMQQQLTTKSTITWIELD